jgi:hypothetical protein
MTRRRLQALVLVWTLPSLISVSVTTCVYRAYRIQPPERLDDAERAGVMAPLRAALSGAPETPCTVHRNLDPGPVAVTVWLDGRQVARIDGSGSDIAEATDRAAKAMRSAPDIAKLAGPDRDRARIQVDIVTGRAPLGNGHWLFDLGAFPGVGDMLALSPGIEGIGVDTSGEPALLLPHELVQAKLLSTKRPAQALPEFAIGVDLQRIAAMLGAKTGAPAAASSLFRFRTDAFVERLAGRREAGPLPLVRGNTPRPELDSKNLRAAAIAGGRYLVAHLSPTGRYIYEHDLTTGVQTDPRSSVYSMPRHAGVTYFLAELYRVTKEDWLREPIERAFKHLADLLAAGTCATTLPDGTAIDCVLDRGEQTAQLGSTALAVVALAEYQRATGDTRYLPLATKFAAFLLFMQRPDGSFRHLYDPRTKKPDDEAQLLYYSGEASLALARMYVITKDDKYVRAAERGLDWLVHWYDFFLGGFMYGEEHWTCIAAEAIWPAVQNDDYRDFCDGYGAFLRGQQPGPGDYPDEDDLAGGYSISAFLLPYNTPSGSRTEAMVSSYLLGKHHGAGDPRIRDQIRAALGYLLGQQIRPDSDFSTVGPTDGGMPSNPIERSVRIDYVQHTCSAMLRASEWIDSD